MADLNQIRFQLKKDIKINEIIGFLGEFKTGVHGAKISPSHLEPSGIKNITTWDTLKVIYDKKPDDNEVSPKELKSLLKSVAFDVYQHAIKIKKSSFLPKEGSVDYNKFFLMGDWEITNRNLQKESADYLLEVATSFGDDKKEKKEFDLSPIADLKKSLEKENPLKSWAEISKFTTKLIEVRNNQRTVTFSGKEYDFALCLNLILDPYYKDFQNYLKNNLAIVVKISNIKASEKPEHQEAIKTIERIKNKNLPFFAKIATELILDGEGKTGNDQNRLKNFLAEFNIVTKILEQKIKNPTVPAGGGETEDEGGEDESKEVVEDTITLDEVVRRIKKQINNKWQSPKNKAFFEEVGKDSAEKKEKIEAFFGDIDNQISEIFGGKRKSLRDLIQYQAENEPILNDIYDEEKEIFSYSYDKKSIDDYIGGLAESIVEYAISKFGKEKTLEEKPPEEPTEESTPATAKVAIPPEVIAALEKDFSRVDFGDIRIGSDDRNKLTNLSKWTNLTIAERRAFLQEIGLLQIIQQKYQSQQDNLENSFNKFFDLDFLKKDGGQIRPEAIASFENTLYSLATQAVLNEVDLNHYLKNLSNKELKKLFNLPPNFTDYENFIRFLNEYYQKNKKILGLSGLVEEESDKNTGKKTTNSKDKNEFRKQVNNHRRLVRTTRLLGEARLVHEVFIVPDSDFFGEIIENEGIEYYQKRQAIILDLWRQRSEEERAAIEVAAKKHGGIAQMAIHEQEKILAQIAENESQTKVQKILKKFGRDKASRNKKRSQNRISKTLNKVGLGGVAGTATNLVAPGLGGILVAGINALPISEKYKKYGLMAIPLAVGGLLAYTLHGFVSTLGGFLGGIIGGVGGLLTMGPAGIIPGWMVGTNVGKIVIPTKISAIGNFFGGIQKGAGSLLSGGGSIAATAVKTFLGVTANATTAILFGSFGTIVALSTINQITTQNAFITQISEIDSALETKYVTIEKTATPRKSDRPVEIDYEITIKPKENYTIVISDLEGGLKDNFRISCSEDPCPSSAPSSSEYDFFQESLAAFENKSAEERTIKPGEELVLEVYFVDFDESYQDAAVSNTFSMNFKVIEAGVVISEDEAASKSEVVCFGDCPIIGDCWPTRGSITQEPYNPMRCVGEKHMSHCGGIKDDYLPDAYDIGTGVVGGSIYSIEKGTVVLLKESEDGFGHHIVIRGNYEVIYAHMSGFADNLVVGSSIDKGQEIGFVGDTGDSSGPHLHFEIKGNRVNGIKEYILQDAFAGTPPDSICGG